MKELKGPSTPGTGLMRAVRPVEGCAGEKRAILAEAFRPPALNLREYRSAGERTGGFGDAAAGLEAVS